MALEKILTDGTENGQSSASKINTAFDQVDSNTTALAGAVSRTNRTPKGALDLSVVNSQSFGEVTYTLLEFDTITTSRGGVTPDLATNSISIPDTDSYELDIALDVEFAQTDEIQIMLFVNGEAVSQEPLGMQGRGNNKPTAISWQTTYNFNEGDVVDVRARNGDAGTLNAEIKRMYFSIKLDL